MSDNKNTSERWYYAEEAYTASAVTQDGKRRRASHRAGKTAFLFILFALLCVAIAVSCAILMMNYNFSLETDDGINIRITKRNAPDSFDLEQRPNISPLFEPDEAIPSGAPSAEALPRIGSKLDVNEKPAGGPEKLSYQEIYDKCAPSIVSISVSQDMLNYEPAGSGIIMSGDGLIIADAFAVSKYSDIKVRLYSGEIFTATLAASDSASGLAVLKIEATKLSPAEFAYSSDLRVGDGVVSISNPVEGSFTLSPGIVSSAEQELNFYGYPISVFQTNAYCGSYCSAVIDGSGNIVGIGSVAFSAEKRLNDLYFVIPMRTVKSVVDDLLEYGYVTGRPALGLVLRDIPASASVFYGMPKGAFVNEVYEKSDAYAKGIKSGDIIVSFNSQPVNSVLSLNELKNKCSVGDTAVLEIIRGDERLTFEIVLEDYSVILD